MELVAIPVSHLLANDGTVFSKWRTMRCKGLEQLKRPNAAGLLTSGAFFEPGPEETM